MMKIGILFYFALLISNYAFCQDASLERLIAYPVGGTWVSDNKNNGGKLEDFQSFYMRFNYGMDTQSVWGLIHGVKNNGYTLKLIEIWNFIHQGKQNIQLIQRTSWGEVAFGTIVPFERKHLDIQFKSTAANGNAYFTRDIHYLDGPDFMKSISYQKLTEADEWKESNTSIWRRITD